MWSFLLEEEIWDFDRPKDLFDEFLNIVPHFEVEFKTSLPEAYEFFMYYLVKRIGYGELSDSGTREVGWSYRAGDGWYSFP